MVQGLYCQWSLLLKVPYRCKGDYLVILIKEMVSILRKYHKCSEIQRKTYSLCSGASCRQPAGLVLRFVTDVSTVQSPLLAMTPAATWLQKPCSADAETQWAVPAQACVSWLTRAHRTLHFSPCVVKPTLEKTRRRENRGSAAMDSLKTKCFLNISMWNCSCEF